MILAVFASTELLGRAGNIEIRQKQEEGKLFAKNNGFTTLQFSEKLGSDAKNGWHELCLAMDANNVQAIWVKRIEELGSDWRDLQIILYILREKRILLFIDGAKQNVSTLTFRRKLSLHYGIPLSELDFLLTSQHKGRLRNIDNGKRIPPNIFGYDYARSQIGSISVTLNIKEASIVRKIYHLYDEGKSFQGIADCIQKSRTKMAGKKIGEKTVVGKFTRFQIMKILRRPEYCGMTYNQDHSKLIQSAFPPIQDLTVSYWKYIQKRLESRARPQNTPHGRNPFSGYITCLHCGSPFYIRQNGSLFHKNDESCSDPSKASPNRNHNLRLDIIKDYLTVLLLSNSPVGDLLEEYETAYKKQILQFSRNLEMKLNTEYEIGKNLQSLNFHMTLGKEQESIKRLKKGIGAKKRIMETANQRVSQTVEKRKQGKMITIPANDFSVPYIIRLDDNDRITLFQGYYSQIRIDNKILIAKTIYGRLFQIDLRSKSGKYATRCKVYRMLRDSYDF